MKMNELREMRDEIESQMREAADSESENVKERITDFLDSMKAEYGFFDIKYEIACQWEDPDSEEQIGMDEIVICSN